MQTQISVFQFQAAQSVRVEIKNGEPWFCLKDVANILEIENSRRVATEMLKASGIEKISVETGGGKQQLTFINEPNLYRVIFRSNKPEAVKFQDWIFEEVIPEIRKTGSYELHLDRWLTEWERAQIRTAVKARCERTGETTQAVYRKLHAFMDVPSYEQIGATQFQTALNFLASIENAPEVFREPQAAIDDDTLISIARVLFHAQDMRLFVKRYLPAFENMGLDRNGALFSFTHDTDHTFERVRNFYFRQVPRLAQGKHKTAAAHLHQRLMQTI